MKRLVCAGLLSVTAALLGACGPEQLPGITACRMARSTRARCVMTCSTVKAPDLAGRPRLPGAIRGRRDAGPGPLPVRRWLRLRGRVRERPAQRRGRYECEDGTVYAGTFAGGDPVRGEVEFADAGRYQGNCATGSPTARAPGPAPAARSTAVPSSGARSSRAATRTTTA
ncbi:hypothetical protein HML84_08685 [Alcanivorax sp. IO_7]|nr:hypothetical protein HML84_08685 [Alcanivorax sp. IO_7]